MIVLYQLLMIYEQNKFKDIFIHANVGDAGGAQGQELFVESINSTKKNLHFLVLTQQN